MTTEVVVQLFILVAVWINVSLGLIALRDRRKNRGLH
jgi:hypothetical protein